MPVKYVPADVNAMKALRHGTATPDQQIRAMEFILEVISARNDMSFRPGPGGGRESDFAEGRRFVGNQIVKLANLQLNKDQEK